VNSTRDAKSLRWWERVADEEVVDGERPDVDPEHASTRIVLSLPVAVARRSVAARPLRQSLQPVEDDEPRESDEVHVMFEEGEPEPVGDGLTPRLDLREEVDEDVRDGDATAEREPPAPRDAVEEGQPSGEEVDGRQYARGGQEQGRREATLVT
jgi:hypothetical protein